MIPPGGEGRIKVTLKPKGQHTTITKDIVVLSNDPAQPRFTLTMKGSLLVDMIAQPSLVWIHDLPPGQPGAESVSLLRTEGSTATVESIRVQDTELFSVREIETEPGALATYEIRFKGRKEVGTSSTQVIVETTGDNTPQLTIPLRANTAFNLRYPKRIAFSWRQGQLLERTINISTRRGDAPKIAKVEDPDGLLDIEVLESVGPTTGIRMAVREDQQAELEPGVPHGLVVHTNDRDEPRLELEYRVMAQRTPRQMKVSAQ